MKVACSLAAANSPRVNQSEAGVLASRSETVLVLRDGTQRTSPGAEHGRVPAHPQPQASPARSKAEADMPGLRSSAAADAPVLYRSQWLRATATLCSSSTKSAVLASLQVHCALPGCSWSTTARRTLISPDPSVMESDLILACPNHGGGRIGQSYNAPLSSHAMHGWHFPHGPCAGATCLDSECSSACGKAMLPSCCGDSGARKASQPCCSTHTGF